MPSIESAGDTIYQIDSSTKLSAVLKSKLHTKILMHELTLSFCFCREALFNIKMIVNIN